MASKILSDNQLNSNTVAFFLCDMQERFRAAIYKFDEILETSRRLIEASRILSIPLIVTEQYPKGLGSTVSQLNIEHTIGKFEKTKFSMALPEVMSLLEKHSIQHIVLFGVETHVCVQQTAIDLLSNGYAVHIIADACSSRSQTDRVFALERLRQMGAIVTTHESVLLQLVASKDHQYFKEIQGLIKDKAPDTGLLYLPSSI